MNLYDIIYPVEFPRYFLSTKYILCLIIYSLLFLFDWSLEKCQCIWSVRHPDDHMISHIIGICRWL